jgi:hypothetical protein
VSEVDAMPQELRSPQRREEGVILFVAVMLLALMGALGIAALDSASTDRQAAGYYNRSNTALFAAEAGVARAKALIENVRTTVGFSAFCPGVIPFPGPGNKVSLGDTSTYLKQGAQPRFYGDPAVANALECTSVETIGLGRRGAQSGATKSAPFLISVIGESPDGSRVRLQVYVRKDF